MFRYGFGQCFRRYGIKKMKCNLMFVKFRRYMLPSLRRSADTNNIIFHKSPQTEWTVQAAFRVALFGQQRNIRHGIQQVAQHIQQI